MIVCILWLPSVNNDNVCAGVSSSYCMTFTCSCTVHCDSMCILMYWGIVYNSSISYHSYNNVVHDMLHSMRVDSLYTLNMMSWSRAYEGFIGDNDGTRPEKSSSLVVRPNLTLSNIQLNALGS